MENLAIFVSGAASGVFLSIVGGFIGILAGY